ncbi:hypothetical protein C5B78_09255 [Aeromonas salmonicida]|nr:hypothetical protein C5B78_09255 [Aeromonas salmonicida]
MADPSRLPLCRGETLQAPSRDKEKEFDWPADIRCQWPEWIKSSKKRPTSLSASLYFHLGKMSVARLILFGPAA